jgi:actin-binding protein IPP
LYVVGGNSNQQEVLKSVERYSFDDDKWENVAPMSVPRASPAVAAVDGFLYVAGGDQTREVNFYRAQITIVHLSAMIQLMIHGKNVHHYQQVEVKLALL